MKKKIFGVIALAILTVSAVIIAMGQRSAPELFCGAVIAQSDADVAVKTADYVAIGCGEIHIRRMPYTNQYYMYALRVF